MSKTKFIELTKGLEANKPVLIKTKYFTWELSFTTKNKFYGLIYRLSSTNKKEQIFYYYNRTIFFNKIMKLAENPNMALVTDYNPLIKENQLLVTKL